LVEQGIHGEVSSVHLVVIVVLYLVVGPANQVFEAWLRGHRRERHLGLLDELALGHAEKVIEHLRVVKSDGISVCTFVEWPAD